MKSTIVDTDGNVRCPVCNGTSFTLKRTGKAKLGAGVAGVLTLGVGGALAIGAMPKRVYCLGCGENLKTGKPGDSAAPVAAGAASAAAAAAPALGDEWAKRVPATALEPGDEFEHLGKTHTAVEVERGTKFGMPMVQVTTAGGKTYKLAEGLTLKARRPA